MTFKLQMIIILSSLFFIFYLIKMIMNNKVSLKYSLSWLCSLILVLFMGLFLEVIIFISEFLGIQSPINALFFIGFIFVLIILYSNTVAQSRISEKIKIMAQDFALENYKK